MLNQNRKESKKALEVKNVTPTFTFKKILLLLQLSLFILHGADLEYKKIVIDSHELI